MKHPGLQSTARAQDTVGATHTFGLLLSPPGLASVPRTDIPQGNFSGEGELGVESELSGAVTGWKEGMPEVGPCKLQSNKAKGKVLQLGQSNPKHLQGASPVTPGVPSFSHLAPSMHHHLLCFSD